jgi:hypothetical protein
MAAVALIGILLFGGDEEKDKKLVQDLCDAPGLNELARIGDVGFCTHGPDPDDAFEIPVVKNVGMKPATLIQTCPGNGQAGPRVVAYTDLDRETVLTEMRYATRQLMKSSPKHSQRIRWLCQDGKPVIHQIDFKWNERSRSHFDHAVSAMRNLSGQDARRSDRISVAFSDGGGGYPYCGEGSVAGGTDSKPDGPHYSFIGCLGTGGVTLHELGHNFGAVRPEAPKSSGDGWHCYELGSAMCYSDGGSYFRAGGKMIDTGCRLTKPQPFDCNQDSYWNPDGFPTNLWNTARNPFLTTIRRSP